MVKVYYIENNKSKDIDELNEDIKGKMKIVCMIYWEDCGACKMMSPNWRSACNEYKNKNPESNLRIAYINKDTLPQIDFDEDVHSFPYIATIQGKKIKEFNPDRSVSGLMQFLEEEDNKMDKKTPKLIGGSTKKKKILNKKTKKGTRKNQIEKVLFKKSKPWLTSSIKVGIHKIFYYCYGNKNGKPVLVVHGGPGGGTSPKMARYFDPKKYFIVLVDQRGSGKSTPEAETKNNNTHELVKDFEKIRKKLNIKKWMLMGGSWGSFLSLIYAIKHPNVISEIVIRGIFLGGKDEIDWVNGGKGANYFYPEKWEDYVKNIPVNERDDLIKAYGKRIEGELGIKEKNKSLLKWATWEYSISKLIPDSDEKIKKELFKNNMYKTFAILEYHYFKNNCFVEKNFLKNKNVYKKISHIPLEIVHGRYDLVCPVSIAYELHKLAPHSKLSITHAGHTMFDYGNAKKIIEITNKYK